MKGGQRWLPFYYGRKYSIARLLGHSSLVNVKYYRKMSNQTLADETRQAKKVMIRLCAKIVADTDLYETDKEVQNLIDWVCLSEQIKENNNTIRNLTGEYKKIEPDCREGVRAQLERMKELCKERNNLYEKQNDLKGEKWKIEKSLKR